MHSIIRLCILVAAVFVQAAPSKANIFGEGGDPTPSDPEKCCGCKGEKPADTLLPDKDSKDGPFVLWSADTQELIKHGTCKGPDDNGECTEDGCSLNAAYYIMPAWPHNGDGDKPKVTWEVYNNGRMIKKPRVLETYTEVLPGKNAYKWACGTTTKIVVKWKKDGIDRSRTKKLICTSCDPPKKK